MDVAAPPPPSSEPPFSESQSQSQPPKQSATVDKPELTRCFICLTDDEDAPEMSHEWVYPSPCSLTAHQSCMLAWVRNRELENKPLECPVCLGTIYLDQPSDALVSLADHVSGLARQAAPRALIVLLMAGTTTGMALYGAGALWVFAGKHALVECLKEVHGMQSYPRYRRIIALPLIGPALILGYNVGPLPMPVSVPMLAVYGSYLVGFDPGTFSWPPSPSTALTVFPYLQASYRALYQALFQEFEDELDHKLNSLPPALIDDPPAPIPAAAEHEVDNNVDVIAEAPAGGRLGAIWREVRTAFAFIQNVNVEAQIVEGNDFDGEDDNFMGPMGELELPLLAEIDGPALHQQLPPQMPENEGDFEPLLQAEIGHQQERAAAHVMHFRVPARPPQVDIEDPWADAVAPVQFVPQPLVQHDHDPNLEPPPNGVFAHEPQPLPHDALVPNVVHIPPAPIVPAGPPPFPAPAGPEREEAGDAVQQQQQEEVAAAEEAAVEAQQRVPVPRQALGTTVSQMCLNIATALVLPGISYCMGEILKSFLPRRFTMMARIPSWSGQARFEHTGLLQTRWGRSLVGGCLYIVLRDAIRLYIKFRRTKITGSRKVRGIPRQVVQKTGE